MKFIPLPIFGAYLIELESYVDDRGYFTRTFCEKEFEEHGLVNNFIQVSTAFNRNKGQIRGMHYQTAPYEETKVVRCMRGAIYDVMIDLRPESPTYNKWYGEILSEDNKKMFYIPKGLAHGYKTLQDNTELLYMMDQIYVKEAARSINHENWGIFS